MRPVIIVHGGAKKIEPEKQPPSREGVRRAVLAGWEALQQSGNAVDAVVATIRVLEDDPTFNAGYGSELNADGQVRMDAGLMEGRTLNAGCVGAIQGVRNPISLARQVLDEEPVLMVGQEARGFAIARGVERCDPADLITEEQHAKWRKQKEQMRLQQPFARSHDTVGCVALDIHGNLACGASTGGTGMNMPGRVGDSCAVGSGIFADNAAAATALTGDGEEIVRTGLGRTVIDYVRDGKEPDAAVLQALKKLEERVQGEAGIILINNRGEIGWGHNSEHMSVAYLAEGMDGPRVFLKKDEEQQPDGA